MAAQVLTATDVKNAASSGGVLHAGPGTLVTALAADLAKDLGVTIVEGNVPVPEPATSVPAPARADTTADRVADTDELTDRIRAIVASVMARGETVTPAPVTRRHPVKHATQTDATMEPFPYPGPPPGMQVRTGDVVTGDDGAPMAAGYMEITAGEFPWTLTYDEVQIVLEGELHLGGDAGGKVGRPGDVLYVPKGSSITFGTPSWAKFVYVTFPANWEDQIG